MLPCLYLGSHSAGKIHQFFHKPWILALAKSVEMFLVSISDMTTIKYWKNLGSMMYKAKEKIPKQCRIGDAFFT